MIFIHSLTLIKLTSFLDNSDTGTTVNTMPIFGLCYFGLFSTTISQ